MPTNALIPEQVEAIVARVLESRKDARQTFLGIWIRCCLEDTPFEVWEGDQLRDFTYVDDAVIATGFPVIVEIPKGSLAEFYGAAASLLQEVKMRL